MYLQKRMTESEKIQERIKESENTRILNLSNLSLTTLPVSYQKNIPRPSAESQMFFW
jgi:hypothetical protein